MNEEAEAVRKELRKNMILHSEKMLSAEHRQVKLQRRIDHQLKMIDNMAKKLVIVTEKLERLIESDHESYVEGYEEDFEAGYQAAAAELGPDG